MNATRPGLIRNSSPLLLATVIMSALLLSMTGCQNEGPAEQVGKKVDQAAQQVGQQVEKAGERIQNAAEGDKR